MKRFAVLLVFSAVAVSAACSMYRYGKNLDSASQEFLSKVRYLISKEERRAFVNLPESERSNFIEEFWKIRDPDPDTAENEFKTQYFQRIDDANRLFGGGQESGWLQDRGRIWILLGPPSDREAYPRGVTFYGKPTEIWYYNFFPIVFIDDGWTGIYNLSPDSAVQLGMIMRAQMEWKPRGEEDYRAFDCAMTVERVSPDRITVRLSIPYKKIWMSSDGKILRTTLTVEASILNASGAKIGDYRQEFPISLSEEKMAEIGSQAHVIEFPLILEAGAAALNLTITNATDGSKAFKKAKLAS